MIILAGHLVHPLGVVVLHVGLDLLTGQFHGVQEVLVLVEAEHVAHEDGAIGSGGQEGVLVQRRGEGDAGRLEAVSRVGADFELDAVDQVDEGRIAEQGIMRSDAADHGADRALYPGQELGFGGLEVGHEFRIGGQAGHRHQRAGDGLGPSLGFPVPLHGNGYRSHVRGTGVGAVDRHHITGRILDVHLDLGHRVPALAVPASVVMPYENEIEAVDAFHH